MLSAVIRLVALVVVLKLCAAQDGCPSEPECDLPTEASSERYWQLYYHTAKSGNLTGVTEPQVKEFCKQHADLLTCEAKYMQQCLPPVNRAALQVFLQNTIAFATVCDRPDLYAKTRVLAGCMVTLGSIYYDRHTNTAISAADHRRYFAEMSACVADVLGDGPYMSAAITPFIFSSVRQSRREFETLTTQTIVQKGVCCVLKKLSTCFPALSVIRDKCTSESVAVMNSIFSAALDQYACTEEQSTAPCPPSTRHLRPV